MQRLVPSLQPVFRTKMKLLGGQDVLRLAIGARLGTDVDSALRDPYGRYCLDYWEWHYSLGTEVDRRLASLGWYQRFARWFIHQPQLLLLGCIADPIDSLSRLTCKEKKVTDTYFIFGGDLLVEFKKLAEILEMATNVMLSPIIAKMGRWLAQPGKVEMPDTTYQTGLQTLGRWLNEYIYAPI